MTSDADDDPFGTASLRARVLAAWSASPARFREDANAEDDLVRGGYRDRVVVELAQNAADAATRAGVPGRLALRLTGDLLTAANTGAALDADGVESLSTLRASNKRDDTGPTVGRFGVGFAAVLAVTDEPHVMSTSGAIRWDLARARDDVSAVTALREELDRRDGQLPVLRLPYPSSARPPEEVTTVVEMPLRDAAARDLMRRLLDEVDDALLLALPALTEIVVQVDGDVRVVTNADRWQVVRRTGRTSPALLADRPVEERDRPTWSVAWARPLARQPVPTTLHAPTPTDEPLDLPALLVAAFPLDPTRRHVAPGALTDALVGEAATAYVDLVLAIEDPSARLGLVPGPVPAGRLDGALRSAIVAALSDAALLRTVDGRAIAPRDAVSVIAANDATLAALRDVLGGLVPDAAVLDRLGVRRLPLADVVDMLADLQREPSWWHRLYGALADGAVDVEALGALPVPLSDGRLVRGARGALLPGADLPTGVALGGVRVVHPEAAHPLLLRLGAGDGSARALLERPEVRQLVESSWELDDPDATATAILRLVAAAELRSGMLPWLSALHLRDEHGDLAPADELVLPGSPLVDLADPDAVGVLSRDVADRWGSDVLTAVGVLSDLTVAEIHDVVLDVALAEEEGALPALAGWVEEATRRLDSADVPPVVPVVVGIAELDVVADDAWEAVLARIANHPALRSALVDPVLVRGLRLPSYTAWWLRTRATLRGRRPGEWATRGSGLTGLYDELDLSLDPRVLAAAGVRTSLADLLDQPEGADELLQRLADPARQVTPDTLRVAYRLLARLDPDSVDPPTVVRVASGTVVAAEEAVVIDAPHHLQLAWSVPPLVVPIEIAPSLADVLDLPRSSQRVGEPPSKGNRRDVDPVVARVLPAAPTDWWEHEDLVVDGVSVSWWVSSDGAVRASTVDGLARGLAWAAGRWESRLLVAALLVDPDRVEELLTEQLLDYPD